MAKGSFFSRLFKKDKEEAQQDKSEQQDSAFVNENPVNEPEQDEALEKASSEPEPFVNEAPVNEAIPDDVTPEQVDEIDEKRRSEDDEKPSVSEMVAPDATEICAQVTAESHAGQPLPQPEPEPEPEPKPAKEQSKPSLWKRLTSGLKKTSTAIGDGLWGIFKDKKIDDELFEELETQLLTADIGVPTTMRIVERLTEQADRRQLKDAETLYQLLQDDMVEILKEVEQPLELPQQAEGPYVILMVGVNGVGKTTTIGKLAQQFRQQGKSVMLAAGDTFRAAAVEQLQVWGERNDIPVIAQHTGADSASVIYDAVAAAKARNVDVLIADTAGRLQNKAHLMDELKKVVRVMKKLDEHAPHEVMLTLDAGTGQNAISQAKLFTEAVGVSGITLTKLDGTAKGGVIFAIADQFNIPIRYIGVGEGIDDLRPFEAKPFVQALFQKAIEDQREEPQGE
ncbi:signal recognition particle-docking protein FtsY [Pseudidiomarina aquimaris]|uniref:Signal recognition particle receptor FtsY n=1 Tax=Pseudidiomarina aquimaris TaxID=641841 RepID=A0A432XNV8_9GAMM|nr:signal recognition particle-docking protein FtsY [Pseudidiomarina aquimaris]RUO50362.1 signal recognition particle-docking protein FtsY [Pseudidiomarina aquimaris]